MYGKFRRLLRDESGITALETAIILIAFVVVAAVFAFTILSAGTTSTEKGKEAIYAGLEEVSSSLELRGSVLATDNITGTSGTIQDLVFTVGTVAGSAAIDLTDTENAEVKNKVVIGYRDGVQHIPELDWTVKWPVRRDEDDLLEDGELAEITIDLSNANLGPDTLFAVEVKPPRGGVLIIEKTTPSFIDKVIDFH